MHQDLELLATTGVLAVCASPASYLQALPTHRNENRSVVSKFVESKERSRFTLSAAMRVGSLPTLIDCMARMATYQSSESREGLDLQPMRSLLSQGIVLRILDGHFVLPRIPTYSSNHATGAAAG